MQRELKFRVWDVENEVFVHTDRMSFDVTNGNRYFDGKQKLWLNLKFNSQLCPEVKSIGGARDENRYIVQQYTGLKDSKGKEIYEGDIMASRGNHPTDALTRDGDFIDIYNVVVWNQKVTRFALKPIHKYLEHQRNPPNPELDNPWMCRLNCFKEVVGNICENPELLHSRKHIDIEENNEYNDELE